MSRQHGLYADAFHCGNNLLRREALLNELADLIAPGSGLRAMAVFAQDPSLAGGVFLDHVQELECNGKRKLKSRRRLRL